MSSEAKKHHSLRLQVISLESGYLLEGQELTQAPSFKYTEGGQVKQSNSPPAEHVAQVE